MEGIGVISRPQASEQVWKNGPRAKPAVAAVEPETIRAHATAPRTADESRFILADSQRLIVNCRRGLSGQSVG